MRGLWCLAVVAVVASASEDAFASLWDIEYGFLQTPRDRIGPWVADSEAESDRLAYTKPLQWNNRWLRARNAFDLSAGSLSSYHLLTDTRLRMETDFSPAWRFRAVHVSYEDREEKSEHLSLSVLRVLSPTLAVGLTGETRYTKSDSDMGVTAEGRVADLQWRVVATAVDVPRGRHSEGDDRFERRPFAFAARASWLPEALPDAFGTAVVQLVTPSVRTGSVDGVSFRLEERSVRLLVQGVVPVGNGASLEGHLEGLRAVTAEENCDECAAGRFEAERVRWIGDLGGRLESETTGFQVGGRWAHRFVGRQGQHAWVDDLLPFGWAWWRDAQQKVSLGGETTRHHERGDARPGWDPAGTRWEGRLNLRYEYRWGADTEITALASFDLDDVGRQGTFEGGNVQFRTAF